MAKMEINKDLVIENSNTALEITANRTKYPYNGEYRIGTFYDGDAVYRQCFVFQFNGTYTENGMTYMWYNTGINFKKVLNIYGTIGSANDYIYNPNTQGVTSTVVRGKQIQVGIITSQAQGQWMFIVLEYIKS